MFGDDCPTSRADKEILARVSKQKENKTKTLRSSIAGSIFLKF